MPEDPNNFAARVRNASAEIAAQIQAYRDLLGAASKASGMSLARVDAALAAFEPAFFNNLLIALDARFPRHPELATGPRPARDEVRALADALLRNGGVLASDDDAPYAVETSVLRIAPGERVALNGDDFEALGSAFLAEIEREERG